MLYTYTHQFFPQTSTIKDWVTNEWSCAVLITTFTIKVKNQNGVGQSIDNAISRIEADETATFADEISILSSFSEKMNSEDREKWSFFIHLLGCVEPFCSMKKAKDTGQPYFFEPHEIDRFITPFRDEMDKHGISCKHKYDGGPMPVE